MKDFKRELATAIKDPDFIYESDSDEFSELYFKKFNTKNYGEIYMMTVVDKSGKNRFVKTGFMVYNLNKGKKLLWRKN